jgi:LmbE family N-acetylglucosaminyl deacetylase
MSKLALSAGGNLQTHATGSAGKQDEDPLSDPDGDSGTNPFRAQAILALFAHPDDAEFLCAGTLAHLAGRGLKIHMATMTAGDCGSTTTSARKIAAIRRGEARRAAKLIRAHYICLNERDLNVFYDRKTLAKVTELVRQTNPSIVFTHSPVDYMVDHETTSQLCQTACFGAMAPNFRTGNSRSAKPLHSVPHLYYAEPFGGRDILGREVRATLFVDIATTLSRKAQTLSCHESQQDFLRVQQGIPQLLDMMRAMAERAGRISHFKAAEGFRQHLGQGFPQDELLGIFLPELVRTIKT